MLVFLWKKQTSMQALSPQPVCFTFLFVFILKSLISLLFTLRYAMEAFLFLSDSSVFAKHSVIY